MKSFYQLTSKIILLALALAGGQAIAGSTCLRIASQLMHPAGEKTSKSDLRRAVIAASKNGAMPVLTDTSDVLAEAARDDIGRRSRALSKMLTEKPADLDLRTYDTLIVGGGPQTAAAAANLEGTRTLVLNKSEDMGTFSRFGDTFYINSGENPGVRSPNLMHVGEVGVEAGELANRTYPPGRVLGNATEITLAMSDADFLLGREATSVSRAPKGSPARYLVKTSEGESFYADRVITATGLGDKKFPFKDGQTLSLIDREYKSGQPRIRFIDDFMADNQKVASTGELPLTRYSGKRVVVIGKGDGGAISSEYLLGHGPPAGYAFQTEKISASVLPKEVTWFGQDAMTGDAYKKKTWERYHDLASDIDAKTLLPVNAHAQRIEEITAGADKGAFKVFYGAGKKDFVVADEVVVGAGYDNSVSPRLFKDLAADGRPESVRTQMVRGNPDATRFNDEVNLAKQVVSADGSAEHLYMAGAGAGGLETVGEAGGTASPRIEALGVRTSHLAKQLRADIKSGRKCLTCDVRHHYNLQVLKSGSTESFTYTPDKAARKVRVSSEFERDTRIEMKLRHLLDQIDLAGGKALDLKIEPDPLTGTLTLKSSTLDKTGLQNMTQILKTDPALSELILSQPASKVNKGIFVAHTSEHDVLHADVVTWFNPTRKARQAFAASELSNAPVAMELKSTTGAERLENARKSGLVNQAIIDNYQPQQFTTFCGVASTCIILRSAGHEIDNTGRAITQDNFLKHTNDVKSELVIKAQEGNDPGFSLQQLQAVLHKKGVKSQVVYANKTMEEGVSSLRQQVIASLKPGAKDQVVANYHGATLGTPTGGHFSPVAGYDPLSDTVLVMDVAEHKNDPFWIPVSDFYYSMTKIDSGSGHPRGYILVETH